MIGGDGGDGTAEKEAEREADPTPEPDSEPAEDISADAAGVGKEGQEPDPEVVRDSLGQIADDALKLLRFTLLIVGVYASVLALLSQQVDSETLARLRNLWLAVGVFALLISLVASTSAYLTSRGQAVGSATRGRIWPVDASVVDLGLVSLRTAIVGVTIGTVLLGVSVFDVLVGVPVVVGSVLGALVVVMAILTLPSFMRQVAAYGP